MGRTGLFVRKTPGGMFAVEDINQTIYGEHFFVSSGHANASNAAGNGRSPDAPVATIDYAIGLCTASQRDVIHVARDHAETISGATSLVCDVEGVTIIGEGIGDSIPTLTFSAAASTISITAPNVTIKNIHCYGHYTNGSTVGITLGALADGCILEDILMTESANTTEFLTGISITAACHDVKIRRLRFLGAAGGTDVSCIVAAGASNNLEITDCYLYGDWSASVVDALAAASTNVIIKNNIVQQADAAAGLGFGMKSDTTGVYANNYFYGAKNDTFGFVGAAMAAFENYSSNALLASGIIKPAVDS
jgi:hypothetical protein